MLSLLSPIYGAVSSIRNRLYDGKILSSHSMGLPAISVGNITAGGTGKTPLVLFIARVLSDAGETVCVLTRGYKRNDERKMVIVSDGKNLVTEDVSETGDEPLELAHGLLDRSAVVADADRLRAGLWARENLGTTVFVLDDAFQHRRVRRDLDIVVIDASNPFGNRRLLPGGTLRESLKNLARADVIVFTRTNLVEGTSDLLDEVKGYASSVPVFISGNMVERTTGLLEYLSVAAASGGAPPNTPEVRSVPSFAFCALGNPENFFGQLDSEGFEVVGKSPFPDHHPYTQPDIDKLEMDAAAKGGEILLTTPKDAVKLKGLRIGLPCYVIRNKLNFEDENGFREMVLRTGHPAA